MAERRQIAKSEWIDAISGSGGLVSVIATRLGIAPSVVGHQINLQQALQKAMNQEENECKDMAECTIRAAIMAQNLRVSMWYLARKAKERGYGTQTKVQVKVEKFERLSLNLPDDGRDIGEGNAKLLN